MQLKELLTDDQGVSPVIGVILMVAITVILAAVIGTFVLGLGGQLSKSAPTANFQFDYSSYSSGSNASLTVSHAGGDTLQASNINASVNGALNVSSPSNTVAFTGNLYGANGEVSAGDTYTINGDDFSGIDTGGTGVADLALNESTVRVNWHAAEGDSSAVLGKWSGPDAS